jgi:large subunit ribosomal protein L25
MAEIVLAADPGRPTGSAASRRLRAAGKIPAVVYGHGMSALAVSVDAKELRHALSGPAGLNQLLSLQVGPDSHLALARELQRHPVRHTVIHVDFQVVRRDEVVSAEVPIQLVGEAKAVEQERGVVEQILTTLSVLATPASIPPSIEIDISALSVGDAIRVRDLPLSPGVRTEIDPDDLVVLASVTRAAQAEEVPGAEAEAEEAAEGAAPGAAAAEEAASGSASSPDAEE